jgi:tetratricopeptide (TPR) repeat protein
LLSSVAVHAPAAANPGEDCLRLHAAGQFAQAAGCYQKIRSASGAVLPWAHYQADAANQLHQDPVPYWRETIAQDPDAVAPRIYLAEHWIANGRQGEARPLVAWLLARAPGSARVRYLAGILDEAIPQLQEAVRLEPRFGQAHYRLALALRRAGRSAEAEIHFREFRAHQKTLVTVEDPLLARLKDLEKSAAAHLSEGRAYEEAGDWARAADAYRAAAAADPGLAQPHVNLIAIHGRLGSWEAAKASFDWAVRLDSGIPESYYNLGVALMAQRKFPEAEALFGEALARNPRYADAHNNLGNLRLARGERGGAEQAFRAALASQPRHSEAHFNLARLTGSRAHFEAALLEESPRTPAHRYFFAGHLWREGSRAEAIAQLELARAGALKHGQKDLADYIDRTLGDWRGAHRPAQP